MTTTESIMATFDKYRLPDTNISRWAAGGADVLRSRVEQFVNRNQRIEFLMLGYPFKSTNHVHKTLSPLPDMAEEVSFKNITMFVDEIYGKYLPGAKLTILSDGLIFNDIFGECERNVDKYHDLIVGMTHDINAPIDILTLHDLYPGLETKVAVEKMEAQFALTPAEVEQRIMFDPNVNWLYRAFIRFMGEEIKNLMFTSTHQRQVAAKKLARRMMTRNEIYSQYAEKEMSNYIRLSMHATTNDHKWGLQLIPGAAAKHSPWHCVLVVGPDGIATLHKEEAVKAGYKLAFKGNQPYYYEAV